MRITSPLIIQIKTASNGYIYRPIQTLANGLDYGVYGRLIQYCTDRRLVRQAKQLHARIVLFSVIPDNFLASKLIGCYSKSNCLHDAYQVFDKIPHRNIFSWNAMLIGFCLQNKYVEALRLFSSLVSFRSMIVCPDNFTMTCVLKVLSSLSTDSRLGKEVHCFVIRRGFDSDIFVVNGMITCYSRCDELGLARKVFDKMPERDIVSWNSMIAGYSQGGLYEGCKGLYREMLGLKLTGLRPNGMTVISVLQACGQSNDLVFGMEVHQFIIESQIELDVSLCNAMIALYAKCGSLDYARDLFEEMIEKDDVTYGSIISGYMVHGFVDQAMNLFQEMKNPGLSTWNAVISGLVQNNKYEGVLNLVQKMQAFGFRPNTVTLSSILPTYSYFSNLKGGKEIHAYALKNSYDKNIYVATAIIDTYAKSGYLHGAERIFNQSSNKSLIVWTAMIAAYAAHGEANRALLLFNAMLNNGICPDEVTFTAVLAACAHSGMVEEARKIFDTMFPKYAIQPSIEQYACMVDVLSRAGKLSEAAEFISKMPVEPNAKVWGALLHGASVFGDVEIGEFVCDHLFRIEPENTGNYIVMANLYSQDGKWEKADKIREKMREIGLKKTPGGSWI